MTQAAVTSEIQKLQNALGVYPIVTSQYLLYNMELFTLGIMALGLVLDIILIILVFVSVLLIYSLLVNSVEQKTFDSGIMRLVGLTKTGYVVSILF